MNSFFSYDSPFMRGLEWIVDVIWVNILLVVTSLPIITVGAALAASNDSLRRIREGEAHVTRMYFRAFASNFGKATALWAVYGVIGAALAYTWIVLRIDGLLIPKIAFSVLWVIGFEWVWYLQSRFENTVGATLRNSLLFGISYPLTTIALAAIDAVAIYVVYASFMYLIQGLFLLAVLGPGFVLSMHVPILERTMKAHIAAGAPNTP
ncbi:YesL family protein [Pseudoscardovia suis]|uniref:Beta-carotene 15,15'-monooxygenase n=1 Tax=Pseudoscardovia suis TaxID=987063 RepID=A0A261EW52_9BIFI|nr:DUF624 domain-containing protein [Pseudoscardovia suis]OZG51068.1 beta-carotene 15,15'-monooxygenase [Pseudoscardovia suis]PJJ62648.1 putative membrane protein YesL [Pseudoscardovia suis]